MPAGVTHPAVGYASFCLVKFAGYALAARFISRSYGRSDIGAWKIGGVRTLIGMAAGAAYFGLWKAGMPPGRPANAFHALPFWYLAGLLPVRIAEWWLLIWLFYDRKLQQVAKGWRTVAAGTPGPMSSTRRRLPASSPRPASGCVDGVAGRAKGSRPGSLRPGADHPDMPGTTMANPCLTLSCRE